MSRSGYSDDGDVEGNWRHIMYRGSVASATRGKRGQRLLRELLEALDAMPDKRLVAHDFQADGAYCALGVLAAKRGIDTSPFDTSDDWYDPAIGRAFDIADPLAREIMYMNDEGACWSGAAGDVSARRWVAMRQWVLSQILPGNFKADEVVRHG